MTTPNRWQKRLLAGACLVAFGVFLVIAVFPTRQWLEQRGETKARAAELAEIEAENKKFDERVAELNDPEQIEAQARRDYGYIKPGETAFGVVPAPEPPIDLPEEWPFNGAEDWLNR